ncbi:unnamed protein product [Pleuronectes platessa]|uniref:Uncharacterized protein n=1 Tax=Pleuronectes platessa TaxID=8262 RepID=A0A9N7U7Y1_PLEPL|nr:unnamed protein product [Pleuronectes platessa]
MKLELMLWSLACTKVVEVGDIATKGWRNTGGGVTDPGREGNATRGGRGRLQGNVVEDGSGVGGVVAPSSVPSRPPSSVPLPPPSGLDDCYSFPCAIHLEPGPCNEYVH